MGTDRETTAFKCKKCKKAGEITISETDHPYRSEVHYFVTDGFAVTEPVYLGSPNVFCSTCGKKVL
jgi:DNA-directed RNA polymerase subunit RPC12/RpoP